MPRKGMASQGQRHFLYSVLRDGNIDQWPSFHGFIDLALKSNNPHLLGSATRLVRIQDIPRRQETVETQAPFRRPADRFLKGDIFVGWTVPDRRPVYLPVRCFGESAHVLMAGRGGSGKSMLLNFVNLQLMKRSIPHLILDTLDQVAQLYVSHGPAEELLTFDIDRYSRNPFLGPPKMSKKKYAMRAAEQLSAALNLEPISTYELRIICRRLLETTGRLSLPALIDYTRTAKGSTIAAIQRRLLEVVSVTGQAFCADEGFDPRILLERSVIFRLKDVPEAVQRLILFDLYTYLESLLSQLAKWKLRFGVAVHEAGGLARRQGMSGGVMSEPYFFKMVRQARNFGICFCLADQTAHKHDASVSSNTGTRFIFSQSDPAAVDYFSTEMRLTPEQKTALMNLRNRFFLLRRPDCPEAFLCKTPTLL